MEYISIIKDDIDLSGETQYLRLPHPRTGQPQLYLPCKSNGDVLLEVVKVTGSHRRSWFIGDDTIEAASLLLHYPVDPIFLVLPIIANLVRGTNRDHPPPFQPLSDLISTAASSSHWALPPPFIKPLKETSQGGHNEDLGRLLKLRGVKKVFKLCCERKVVPLLPPSPPASPSTSTSITRQNVYYRPSLDVALRLLRRKLEYMASEDQFEMFDHLVRGLSRDGLLADSVSPEIVKLARTKAAGEHLGQWLHPEISSSLVKEHDFALLSDHLANRAAAAAAAAAPITNKKGGDASAGAGVKRKAQPQSRGVEESLKKVNTSSMAKLTNFFKPKDGKK